MDETIKSVVIGPTEHTRECLEEILQTPGYSVEAVYGLDQSWKHRKARWTTFDDLAKINDFELHYVRSIKDQDVIESIRGYNPDVIFEFGASQIVPKDILDIPKYGCIGSHGGPLPDYKGAATLNWAIIKDKKNWGVSLFYLAEGVDEGDIIGVGNFTIDDRDDIATVHQKSDYQIRKLLREALPQLRDTGETNRTPNGEGTYWEQRRPKDGNIDWTQSPRDIYNFVRAQTHPFPGAFTYLHRGSQSPEKVHVWKSHYFDSEHDTSKPYGTILNGSYDHNGSRGILVNAHQGTVLLERLSSSNTTEMWGDDFYHEKGISSDAHFTNKES